MKGTFFKDLLNIRGQFCYYAVVVVIFFIVSALSGNLYFYAGVSSYCGVVAPLSALSYDEKDGWEPFALAAGVTRKELVLSRYLLGGAVMLPVWALSFLFFALPSLRTAENLYVLLSFGGMGLLVMSATLPFVFKLGVEKARAVYIVLIVACMALCIGAASLIVVAGGEGPLITAAALVAAGVVSVPVSAAFSLSIYRKKDF